MALKVLTGRPNFSINRLGKTFSSDVTGKLSIDTDDLKLEVVEWVTLAQIVDVYGFKEPVKTKEA